jgi:uncharacterized protein (TIGR02452 family)
MCDSRGSLPEAEQVDVSVVSAAAQDLRPGRHYSKPFDPDLLKEKTRAILSVCAQNGHDAVVLGAIGCGAFQQDPRNVARVFQDLLKNEFRVFRVAIFAILGARGSEFREFERCFRKKPDLDAFLVKLYAESDNPS